MINLFYKLFHLPLIRYGIVGASGVLVNTSVLYALTEWFEIYYLISAVVASELSIINNFLLNDNWTFDNKNSKFSFWQRLFSYEAISVIGTAILIAIMFILTEEFNVYYIYANWGGIGIVFFLNFFLNKYITWKK